MNAGSFKYTLIGFAILLTTSVFAANKGSFQVQSPVTLGGTQLPTGEYTVQWEGTGPDVELQVNKKDNKVKAHASAKLVALSHPYSDNSVVITLEGNGSRTLREIRFSGKKVALEIELQSLDKPSCRNDSDTKQVMPNYRDQASTALSVSLTKQRRGLKISANEDGNEEHSVTGNVVSEFHEPKNTEIAVGLGEYQTALDDCFSRYSKLLYFLACRVLGDSEGAEDVVRSCRMTASKNRPSFEYEGAFRSWLARILIDEAVEILRERKTATADL